MSLFGFKQLANMMTGGSDHDPKSDPSAAFNTVGDAAQHCLGDTWSKLFQTGDRLLRSTVDVFFGWQPHNDWLDHRTSEPWTPANAAHELWGDPHKDSTYGHHHHHDPEPAPGHHASESWVGGWGPMPSGHGSPSGAGDAMPWPSQAGFEEFEATSHYDQASQVLDQGLDFASFYQLGQPPRDEPESWAAMQAMSADGLGATDDGSSSDPSADHQGAGADYSMVGGWGPMPSLPDHDGAAT